MFGHKSDPTKIFSLRGFVFEIASRISVSRLRRVTMPAQKVLYRTNVSIKPSSNPTVAVTCVPIMSGSATTALLL